MQGCYTLNDAKAYISSLLRAVDYLHSNMITHRDIKPENLLVRCGKKPELVLIDFGLARCTIPGIKMRTVCGTHVFMAPEVLLGKPYDNRVDCWAAGTVAFYILCGYAPFKGREKVRELF